MIPGFTAFEVMPLSLYCLFNSNANNAFAVFDCPYLFRFKEKISNPKQNNII
jgi:hypothetical protein